MITLSDNILKIIDEQVYINGKNNNNGRRFNRSEYIEKAIDSYFKFKFGLAYKSLKK